ncbi:MAG: hypothetical protein C5B49_01090 [Bdellovibrio sp.]|nr:MAG: hypothetical protein C5B49_01090 [Bdellovibrio sp.]
MNKFLKSQMDSHFFYHVPNCVCGGANEVFMKLIGFLCCSFILVPGWEGRAQNDKGSPRKNLRTEILEFISLRNPKSASDVESMLAYRESGRVRDARIGIHDSWPGETRDEEQGFVDRVNRRGESEFLQVMDGLLREHEWDPVFQLKLVFVAGLVAHAQDTLANPRVAVLLNFLRAPTKSLDARVREAALEAIEFLFRDSAESELPKSEKTVRRRILRVVASAYYSEPIREVERKMESYLNVQYPAYDLDPWLVLQRVRRVFRRLRFSPEDASLVSPYIDQARSELLHYLGLQPPVQLENLWAGASEEEKSVLKDFDRITVVDVGYLQALIGQLLKERPTDFELHAKLLRQGFLHAKRSESLTVDHPSIEVFLQLLQSQNSDIRLAAIDLISAFKPHQVENQPEKFVWFIKQIDRALKNEQNPNVLDALAGLRQFYARQVSWYRGGFGPSAGDSADRMRRRPPAPPPISCDKVN